MDLNSIFICNMFSEDFKHILKTLLLSLLNKVGGEGGIKILRREMAEEGNISRWPVQYRKEIETFD